MQGYLNAGEGRDLRPGGNQDVLGVDDLLAAVVADGRHLVLTAHPPVPVYVGHLTGSEVTTSTPD